MSDSSASCYTDFGCFSKGLNFLRQKIIQHAVQTSDWPPPEVIFGAKSPNPYESRSDGFFQSPVIVTRKLSSQRPSPSKIHMTNRRKKLKFKSSRTGGLTCVGSSDMSTIVAGFVEFERSFNRMSLSKVQTSHVPAYSNDSDTNDSDKPPVKHKRVSGSESGDHRSTKKSNKTAVDPQLLGHAIELCLKERTKSSDK